MSLQHDLYDGLAHRSILALPEMQDRTLLVRSFTKSFSMPGGALDTLWRMPICERND